MKVLESKKYKLYEKMKFKERFNIQFKDAKKIGSILIIPAGTVNLCFVTYFEEKDKGYQIMDYDYHYIYATFSIITLDTKYSLENATILPKLFPPDRPRAPVDETLLKQKVEEIIAMLEDRYTPNSIKVIKSL